jgi:hypothetical protein
MNPRTPRPVYCSTWHLHHDMSVARDICAGRFTHAGATVVIPGQPSWMRNDLRLLPAWWAECSEFNYTLNLAYAFHTTGEPRYVDTWQRLVGAWAADVRPDAGSPDALARRVQNWLYSWAAFEESLSFTQLEPIIQETVVESVTRQAQHLRAHLAAKGSRRTEHLYGLLVVALGLPEGEGSADLRRFAWAELQRRMLEGFSPNRRRSPEPTHELFVELRTFLSARENARRFDLPVQPEFDLHLKAAVEAAIQSPHVEESEPPISVADPRDSLVSAAELLRRPFASRS